MDDFEEEMRKFEEGFAYRPLPRVSIHSIIEDQYSKYYEPRESCACGCKEWIYSEMDILKPTLGHVWPRKQVHRCKQCNCVRMADLRGE
jgi:hypothetical protein